MDVTDHLRLSQGEEITVVQQVLRRVLEALPADVSFCHAVGADRRAHRSIDDGDSTLEDLFKRMLVVFRHVSLMALSVAMSAISAQSRRHLAGTEQLSSSARLRFSSATFGTVARLFYYSDIVNVSA